ncbi:hypothetical protein HGI15_21850 [Modestobacter lapidis]|nr:hypothetical protein [Modestobacter lapidis]
MRMSAIKRFNNIENLKKLSLSQPSSISVEVTDLKNNTIIKYNAIKAAARDLNIDHRHILNYVYLNNNKPILNRYIFKLIKPEALDNNDNNLNNLKYITNQKNSQKLEVLNLDTATPGRYPPCGQILKK